MSLQMSHDQCQVPEIQWFTRHSSTREELAIWKGMANYHFLLRSTAPKLLISFLCLMKVVTNSVQCQNNALNFLPETIEMTQCVKSLLCTYYDLCMDSPESTYSGSVPARHPWAPGAWWEAESGNSLAVCVSTVVEHIVEKQRVHV